MRNLFLPFMLLLLAGVFSLILTPNMWISAVFFAGMSILLTVHHLVANRDFVVMGVLFLILNAALIVGVFL